MLYYINHMIAFCHRLTHFEVLVAPFLSECLKESLIVPESLTQHLSQLNAFLFPNN